MSEPAFCTVEYLDDRGEGVIAHAVLTVEQQAELIREFAEHGIVAQIIPHAPPGVPSEDDTIPRLGGPPVRSL